MSRNESLTQQALAQQLETACALHQAGAYAEAETRYRRLLLHLPDCWQLLHNLGLLLHDSGRYDEAAEMYRRALQLGVEDGDLYFNLAVTCKQRGQLDQAIIYYQKALELQPDDNDYRYNLAGCYLADGRHEAAIAIYETVLRSDPGHLSALNNLAYLYHITENIESARELYQLVLTLRPDDSAAEHMLAALDGEQRSSAPADYIRDTFNQYAYTYDASLLGKLRYRVPERLDALIPATAQREVFTGMLDLGCGTGLIGERFRESVDLLHGVDLSENMIALADRKNCYDDLFVAEIEQFLRHCANRYDLIVAADVFPYVGQVENILQGVRDIATDDAVFFFTTEALKDTDCPVYLGQNGRFAHADHFIRDCASDCGWIVDCAEHIPLRKERDQWVAGTIYGLSTPTR